MIFGKNPVWTFIAILILAGSLATCSPVLSRDGYISDLAASLANSTDRSTDTTTVPALVSRAPDVDYNVEEFGGASSHSQEASDRTLHRSKVRSPDPQDGSDGTNGQSQDISFSSMPRMECRTSWKLYFDKFELLGANWNLS